MSQLEYFNRMISISELLEDKEVREELKSRLLDKSMPEPNTGCWFWMGDTVKGGYGRTTIGRVKVLSHRASYECFVNKIPKGLTVDHKCNQPNCINPQHLEAITQYDNTMKGKSFSTINAQKTHCPKGHEYNQENTFYYKINARRDCKICMKERGRKQYEINRDKILAQTKARRNAKKRSN